MLNRNKELLLQGKNNVLNQKMDINSIKRCFEYNSNLFVISAIILVIKIIKSINYAIVEEFLPKEDISNNNNNNNYFLFGGYRLNNISFKDIREEYCKETDNIDLIDVESIDFCDILNIVFHYYYNKHRLQLCLITKDRGNNEIYTFYPFNYSNMNGLISNHVIYVNILHDNPLDERGCQGIGRQRL
jgi:hypothetical protein